MCFKSICYYSSSNTRNVLAVTVVMLIVWKYCSAQCNPAAPNNLDVSAINTQIQSNNNFRPKIGDEGTDWWTVFSATQVQTYGLWCQVLPEDNMGMEDNIGDWYYPSEDTSDGFTLLSNGTSDTVPYQSLKCANQIGLVVDGDVTNYQGIVRCTTPITGLNRQSNYFVVYSDSVFNSYHGPIVETPMKFSLLSSRDIETNIMFTLSFIVSYGPPSMISCYHGYSQLFSSSQSRGTGISELSREVIRSHYINSSHPDMTRVSIRVMQPKEPRAYTCTATAEGRININKYNYDFFNWGSGTTIASITVANVPTEVTASRNGRTSVLVAWTAPHPAPFGYEVFYQFNNGNIVSGGNTSNTDLTLTGPSFGNYSFFVVSVGAENDPVLPSTHSETATITIGIPQLQSTPNLDPRVNSIIVSWTPTQFPPDSYNVSHSCQLTCGSALTQLTDTVNGTSTTYTFSAAPGSRCSVSIVAIFNPNYTTNTIISSTNTLSAAPTGAPGGLTSTSVESRSLSVAWGTLPCPHQRGPITGYRLRYSNGTSIVNTMGEWSRQHVLTGLTPFTSYSVQVAAVNDGGHTGPYSTPLTVETLQDVPGPVSGLSAIPGVVQLTISWSPPSEPNGIITMYQVSRNISGVLNYTNTSATQHTLRDLPPNTVVTFSVRAYTIIGPGEAVSNSASTTDTPPISVVSVELVSNTAVRVTWTPLNLPVVDHYTVHYSIVNGGSRRKRQSISGSVNYPASVSSGVVSGLLEGEQYQFSVSVTLSVGGVLYMSVPGTAMSLMAAIDMSPTASTAMVFTDQPWSTCLSSCPSWYGYSAALGVVSALLVISLVGHIVYTAVVCVLVRKRRQFSLNTKKIPPINATNFAIYDQPEFPIKVETENNKAYCKALTMYDSVNDSIYDRVNEL